MAARVGYILLIATVIFYKVSTLPATQIENNAFLRQNPAFIPIFSLKDEEIINAVVRRVTYPALPTTAKPNGVSLAPVREPIDPRPSYISPVAKGPPTSLFGQPMHYTNLFKALTEGLEKVDEIDMVSSTTDDEKDFEAKVKEIVAARTIEFAKANANNEGIASTTISPTNSDVSNYIGTASQIEQPYFVLSEMITSETSVATTVQSNGLTTVAPIADSMYPWTSSQKYSTEMVDEVTTTTSSNGTPSLETYEDTTLLHDTTSASQESTKLKPNEISTSDRYETSTILDEITTVFPKELTITEFKIYEYTTLLHDTTSTSQESTELKPNEISASDIDGTSTTLNEITTAFSKEVTPSEIVTKEPIESTVSQEITTVCFTESTLIEIATEQEKNTVGLTDSTALPQNKNEIILEITTAVTLEVTTLDSEPTTTPEFITGIYNKITNPDETSTTYLETTTYVPNDSSTVIDENPNEDQLSTIVEENTTCSSYETSTTVRETPTNQDLIIITEQEGNTYISTKLTTVTEENTNANINEATTSIQEIIATDLNETTTAIQEAAKELQETTSILQDSTTTSPNETTTKAEEIITVTKEPTNSDLSDTSTVSEEITTPVEITTEVEETTTSSTSETTIVQETTTDLIQTAELEETTEAQNTTIAEQNDTTTLSEEVTTCSSDEITTASQETTTADPNEIIPVPLETTAFDQVETTTLEPDATTVTE